MDLLQLGKTLSDQFPRFPERAKALLQALEAHRYSCYDQDSEQEIPLTQLGLGYQTYRNGTVAGKFVRQTGPGFFLFPDSGKSLTVLEGRPCLVQQDSDKWVFDFANNPKPWTFRPKHDFKTWNYESIPRDHIRGWIMSFASDEALILPEFSPDHVPRTPREAWVMTVRMLDKFYGPEKGPLFNVPWDFSLPGGKNYVNLAQDLISKSLTEHGIRFQVQESLPARFILLDNVALG